MLHVRLFDALHRLQARRLLWIDIEIFVVNATMGDNGRIDNKINACNEICHTGLLVRSNRASDVPTYGGTSCSRFAMRQKSSSFISLNERVQSLGGDSLSWYRGLYVQFIRLAKFRFAKR